MSSLCRRRPIGANLHSLFTTHYRNHSYLKLSPCTSLARLTLLQNIVRIGPSAAINPVLLRYDCLRCRLLPSPSLPSHSAMLFP